MRYKIASYMRLIIAILIIIFILSPGIILDSYVRIGLGAIGLITLYSACGLKTRV